MTDKKKGIRIIIVPNGNIFDGLPNDLIRDVFLEIDRSNPGFFNEEFANLEALDTEFNNLMNLFENTKSSDDFKKKQIERCLKHNPTAETLIIEHLSQCLNCKDIKACNILEDIRKLKDFIDWKNLGPPFKLIDEKLNSISTLDNREE